MAGRLATISAAALFLSRPATAQDYGLPDGAHGEDPLHVSGAGDTAEAGDVVHAVALVPNVGNGGFVISTAQAKAQAFFSNGMALNAAFAHDRSVAAMKEAVRLDPLCAMCLWGQALAEGPNLNNPVDAEGRARLLPLVRRARTLSAKGGDRRERALIDAMIARYSPGKPGRRDRAYRDALVRIAADYPADDEIQVLAADAIMLAADDAEEMRPAFAYLNPVLARNPDHTPAIHFYIHLAEITGDPARAEPFADRLAAMSLDASHLVHMPSHIWYWVGRYQDATDANIRAVTLDEARAGGGHGTHGDQANGMVEPAVWDLPYHAHNVIFGLGGALMAGDSRAALRLARPLIAVSQEQEDGHPIRQLLVASAYFAMARFEDPAVVLELAEPRLPYLAAAWRYARGEALAYRGDADGVREEMAAIPASIEPAGEGEALSAPEQMLAITRAVLRGRLASMEGRHRDAAAAFAEAAEIEETEDFSRFSDPPAFWYPVRRDLAAALLAAGDRTSALREAEATLKIRPRDPVTLTLITRIEAAASE